MSPFRNLNMCNPTFDIDKYKVEVNGLLASIEPQYRRCFEAWCVRSMYDKYRLQLLSALSPSEVRNINSCVTLLGSHVAEGTSPSAAELESLHEFSNSIDVNKGDFFIDILLVQLLGALDVVAEDFYNPTAQQAMLLAIYLINCVDAEVSEREGRSPRGDLSAVPEIARELDIQRKMLQYLRQATALSIQDLTRFRDESAS